MKEERLLSDPAEIWFLRTQSSYEMAKAEGNLIFPEDRCYALQQAAEKAINAIFILRDETFSYTHDISLLLRCLNSSGLTIPSEILKSVILTPYATQTQYPGFFVPVTGR